MKTDDISSDLVIYINEDLVLSSDLVVYIKKYLKKHICRVRGFH